MTIIESGRAARVGMGVFMALTMILGRTWRLARWSPRGAWIGVRWWGRWIADREGATACATLAAGDALAAAKHKSAAERHWRQMWVRLCLSAAIVAASILILPRLPMWAALTVPAVVLMLGLVGRPGHVAEEVDPQRATLSGDEIVQSLAAALPAVARALKDEPRAVRVRGAVHRDGPGWTARVELPPGVTVEDTVRVHGRLASGLRVPADRLHLATGEHAGQVEMWVADRRPSEMPVPSWRLATEDRFSMFDPIPIGVDLKGGPVEVSLMYGSMVLGAVPQMGKTAALRLVQTAAVLDPTCTLLIFDMKGGGDAVCLEAAADVLRAGDSPDDLAVMRDVLEQATAHMRRVYGELRARNAPKLTRDLAREIGVGPTLISIDECQLAFRDQRITDLVEDLIRRGPAAGIMLCLATQRPTVDSIPAAIRDNASARIALRVMNQPANDAVLGSGAYSSGLDATRFTGADRGVAIVSGEGADGVVARMAFLTTDAAKAIADRHPCASRFDAPGDTDPGSVLDHIIAVWPGGDRATVGQIRAALSVREEYSGWLDYDVAAALRSHGVEPRKLRVGGVPTHSVVLRSAVEAATGGVEGDAA